MPEEPESEELRAEQLRRERDELSMADAARDAEEEAKHERRAEKAAYLREKLEERTDSERER